MLTIPFDARGAMGAFAYFLGILLILGVVLLAGLRRERLGRFGLSRRTRITGFAVVAVLYVGAIYGWLWWRTFYGLRIDPAAGRLELTVLMPERTLAWPLAEITAIRAASGSKAGMARLEVETRDGRTYHSPDLRSAEIAEIDRQIARLTR